MIETLRIANLAIVERAEIEFGPGLNVLTGETGAGKSVVLGALALLAGARASAGVVREGAEEARVEAVFRTERLPELEAALAERGLEADEHTLVVSRSLARTGRGRAQVAGRLIPVGTLAELFAGRLEISSQHESQALRRAESHGRLLDAFGGLLGRRREVTQAYEALRTVRAERARLAAEAEERARREDFLAFQCQEIDAARLTRGERAALEAERARLAHADRLAGEASAGAALLAGDPSVSDAPSAGDLAAEAARRIAEMARLDAALEALAERVRSAQTELLDAARELARYVEGIEADPARLAEVEDRLRLLERLGRKYGGNEEEILATRERLGQELAEMGGSDARLRELEGREAELARQLATRAAALSGERAQAARRLAREVEAALAELGMPKTRLEVALEPAPAPEGLPCGPLGAESAEFRLAANPGEPPQSLRRIASGGELSRVFLALKDVLRRADAGMVLVFDEVDAAIGGRAADRVGRVLAELAGDHQVLCITHLPQIAAFADRHLHVVKRVRGGRTVVELSPLGEEARVEEIARMAGGESITDATRRHARELLGAQADSRRSPPRRSRRR